MPNPNERTDIWQRVRPPLTRSPESLGLFSDDPDRHGLPPGQQDQDSAAMVPGPSVQPQRSTQEWRASTAGGDVVNPNPFTVEVTMHNSHEHHEQPDMSQPERKPLTAIPETTALFSEAPVGTAVERATVESNRPVERTEAPTVDPLPAWEEGQVYICRQGRLEHVQRDPEDMRKVRMTEVAYQTALELGKTLRKSLHGYKPDVALIVSALVIAAGRDPEAAGAAVRHYVRELFQETR